MTERTLLRSSSLMPQGHRRPLWRVKTRLTMGAECYCMCEREVALVSAEKEGGETEKDGKGRGRREWVGGGDRERNHGSQRDLKTHTGYHLPQTWTCICKTHTCSSDFAHTNAEIVSWLSSNCTLWHIQNYMIRTSSESSHRPEQTLPYMHEGYTCAFGFGFLGSTRGPVSVPLLQEGYITVSVASCYNPKDESERNCTKSRRFIPPYITLSFIESQESMRRGEGDLCLLSSSLVAWIFHFPSFLSLFSFSYCLNSCICCTSIHLNIHLFIKILNLCWIDLTVRGNLHYGGTLQPHSQTQHGILFPRTYYSR